MLATISPEPFASMQRSREPLPGLPDGFMITREEADKVAGRAYDVAVKYDLAKYFTGKTPVAVLLALTIFSVYGPRFVITLATVRAVRQGQLAVVPQGPTMTEPGAANDTTPRPRMNLI